MPWCAAFGFFFQKIYTFYAYAYDQGDGDGDGGGGDGGGRILQGQTHTPTHPGTKYPVRGIPSL